MNELQIFQNESFGEVRVVEWNGEPWFVAKDVCECLDIRTDSIRSILEEDEIDSINPNSIGVPSGGRNMLIVSEPGLYSLVLRSRKLEAKAFKRWVTHDILPSIRKTGEYGISGLPNFSDPVAAARAWADKEEQRRIANEARIALEAQAALDRPKVVFADSIEVSKTSILVGEMAKLIKQATGYDIGQTRMFAWLRVQGYLHKGGSQKNMPTQRSIDAGWMKIKEGTRTGSSGECHITKTTKVTGKGQIYFINMFKHMAVEKVA